MCASVVLLARLGFTRDVTAVFMISEYALFVWFVLMVIFRPFLKYSARANQHAVKYCDVWQCIPHAVTGCELERLSSWGSHPFTFAKGV